jgi:hypothetical protein
MKTNQVMQRTLPMGEMYNEQTVRQRTEDGFFNATDLLQIYNSLTGSEKRLQHFMENKGTLDFIDVIIKKESELNNQNSGYLENPMDPIKTTRGKNGGTWMHPYLFIDFAMWLSPEFKYNVIKWVYDKLIKFRHDAGDNYKLMSAAIKNVYGADRVNFQIEARLINSVVTGREIVDRNTLSEFDLDLMSRCEKLNANLINKGLDYGDRKKHLLFFVQSTRLAA